MKRLLLVLALLVGRCFPAISCPGGAGNECHADVIDNGHTTPVTCTLSNLTSGDDIFVSAAEVTPQISGISNGADTFVQKVSYSNGRAVEIWGVLGVTNTTSPSVTFSADGNYSVSIARCTGVGSYGASTTNFNSGVANASLSITTTGTNSYFLAAFNNQENVSACSGTSGTTLLTPCYQSNQLTVQLTVAVNTTASSGVSLADSYSWTGGTDWYGGGIELLASAPPPTNSVVITGAAKITGSAVIK